MLGSSALAARNYPVIFALIILGCGYARDRLHATKSTDKPPRKDADTISLACKPNPGDCPAETTHTPRSSTTTTTSPACVQTNACSVGGVGELLDCLTP